MAEPPHSAPPSKPGITTVACSVLNGLYGPSLTKWLNCSLAQAFISGVRVVSIFSVSPWRAKGAGAVGNGWLGDAFSPGIALGGTATSSIGNSDSPLSRSNRNT